MIRHRGVIHNGRIADRLPPAALYAQVPLRGGATLPFLHKPLRFDGNHFRLFSNWQDVNCVDNTICLTFALQRPFDLEEMGGDVVTGLRFNIDKDMRQAVKTVAGQDARALPVAVPLADHDLSDAVRQNVLATLRRIDHLPGRSLYKRVDTFLRLERARDFLETRFIEDPTTEDLATEAAISRAHFIRLYGSFYGISPKQRILELKVDEAKSLLEETTMSIWEVAEAAGFGNRCAFQRMFRQRVGQTPGEYRQRFSYRRATRSVYARAAASPLNLMG